MGTLGLALLGGGLVAAQTADDHAAHHPAKAAPAKAAPTKPAAKNAGAERGMKGHAGMGMGMMNGCAMGGGTEACGPMGMCPGMLGATAKVEVTKQPKGVTISITSDDAKVVARVQKMAEAMRLMHEAGTQ
jgi:outer membrane lipoprotein SlyB